RRRAGPSLRADGLPRLGTDLRVDRLDRDPRGGLEDPQERNPLAHDLVDGRASRGTLADRLGPGRRADRDRGLPHADLSADEAHAGRTDEAATMTKFQIGYALYGTLALAGVVVPSILAFWFRKDFAFPTFFRTVAYLK